MPQFGTPEVPLRVAVIGSGPSGFYTTEALFKTGLNVKVDMIERLPTPFGLVRYGVAPDHPKIKNVIKIYEKTAENPNFSFLGNVTVGQNIKVNELKKFYHAIIFATGAETDRRLGITGEDLLGSHTATEFVGWYNGHPDYQDRVFDLSHETAIIVGQGNVAMDVARILCKTPDELKGTDITQNALDHLAESKIKEVHMFGRRGPIQASFTPSELKEFLELADCHTIIDPKELELNSASLEEMNIPENAPKKKNYEILQQFLQHEPGNKRKRLYIHYFRSPIEILGARQVEKVAFEKNKLTGTVGQQKVRGTGVREEFPCGIFFRSIGYRGVPIKGLPFQEQSGVIPNQQGRVCDSEQIYTGLYVAGWIKRGPTGIIGTNKPDAEETVKNLVEDIPELKPCEIPSTDSLRELLKRKEVRVVTFDDWKKIDAAEIKRGEAVGKPREKFMRVTGMLSAI